MVSDELLLSERQQDAGDNGPINASRFDVVRNQIIVWTKGSVLNTKEAGRHGNGTLIDSRARLSNDL